MSRNNPPIKIHAEHWDADEYVFIRASYSMPAAQRVAYHWKHIDPSVESLESIAASTEHMCAALLEFIASWSLRVGDTAYEPGVERAKLDLTPENIAELSLEDITFIFRKAMPIFKAANPVEATATIITPDAEADGLTPENFRLDDATHGDISGGPEMAQPIRALPTRRRA